MLLSMFTKVRSVAIDAIEPYPIEVDSGWGDTVTPIADLPDTASQKWRGRISE